jgi:hypothetical protein
MKAKTMKRFVCDSLVERRATPKPTRVSSVTGDRKPDTHIYIGAILRKVRAKLAGKE